MCFSFLSYSSIGFAACDLSPGSRRSQAPARFRPSWELGSLYHGLRWQIGNDRKPWQSSQPHLLKKEKHRKTKFRGPGIFRFQFTLIPPKTRHCMVSQLGATTIHSSCTTLRFCMLCAPVKKKAQWKKCAHNVSPRHMMSHGQIGIAETQVESEKSASQFHWHPFFSQHLWFMSLHPLYIMHFDLQTLGNLGPKSHMWNLPSSSFNYGLISSHASKILIISDTGCHILTTNPQGHACEPAAHLAFSSSNTVQTQ